MAGPPAIYTTGYGGKLPADLKRLVEESRAVLLDIRFCARSPAPRWRKGALASLLGDSYRHVRELGNSAYKERGRIEIADLDGGTAVVESYERAVILMCGCTDAESCHRRTVARHLEARGHAVVELSNWSVFL